GAHPPRVLLSGKPGAVQLRRPAFRRIADLKVRYLSYGALEKDREAIERFGHGLKPIQAISHLLTPA
ncbi:MAG: hypothetical protein ABF751_09185, partial [Acetobacter orientalis]